MKKFSKYGEHASAFPKKEKKKRRKPLTPEKREYISNRIENKVKESKILYGHELTPNLEPLPCEHKETFRFGNKLTCRYCGEILKKVNNNG